MNGPTTEKVHTYLTRDLGLIHTQRGTGSHINKYNKPGDDINCIMVPHRHGKAKELPINITKVAKNIAQYLDGDITKYIKYKEAIQKL